MSARFVGRSVPRVNDEPMLRGSARYVADLAREIEAGSVVRSAHETVERLDIERALSSLRRAQVRLNITRRRRRGSVGVPDA